MARPIVLFGATGYTGRLVADALVTRDVRPLLAARNEVAVKKMAEELGGLETAVADVSRPDTLRAIVDQYTVLVSTVGPLCAGAPRRWRPPSTPVPCTSTPRASRRSSARCSSSATGRRAPAAPRWSRRSATTSCRATSPRRWRWSAPENGPRRCRSATS